MSATPPRRTGAFRRFGSSRTTSPLSARRPRPRSLRPFSKTDHKTARVELPILRGRLDPFLAQRPSPGLCARGSPSSSQARARYSAVIRPGPGSSPRRPHRPLQAGDPNAVAALLRRDFLRAYPQVFAVFVEEPAPNIQTSARLDVQTFALVWAAPRSAASNSWQPISTPSPAVSSSSSGSRRPINRGQASSCCSSAVGPARVPSLRSNSGPRTGLTSDALFLASCAPALGLDLARLGATLSGPRAHRQRCACWPRRVGRRSRPSRGTTPPRSPVSTSARLRRSRPTPGNDRSNV